MKKSHPLLSLFVLPLLFPLSSWAVTAQQCRTKSQELQKKCQENVDRTYAANQAGVANRQSQIGGAGSHRSAEIGSMEMLDAYNRSLEAAKECKKQEDQCKKVCDETRAPANERQQVAKEFKTCTEETSRRRRALEGAGKQSDQGSKDNQKSADKSGSDKGQQGGEQGKGGAPPGGAPPGGAPPQGEKPTNQAQQQTPTALPGQVSGGAPGPVASAECNEASFQTNPNCVPKATTGTPTIATVEDPLKKKCEGTTDNSAECLAYRGQKAGLNLPAGGLQTASANGGGGGGGATASGTQAALTPNIKIPETGAGIPEGLGAGVDSSGGHSGYGTASAGGAGLEDLPPLGGSRLPSGTPTAGTLGAMSANATDIGKTPGPSVISIVSDVIRNRCNAGRFLHCEPKR